VIPSPVAGKSLLTVHEPLGVAALISPWNFPIGMPARKVRSLTSPMGEKSLLTVHEPLGVAALIAPWNFPIGMSARKVRFLTSPVDEKNLMSLPRKTLLKSAYDTYKHRLKLAVSVSNICPRQQIIQGVDQ
jgi:hypothetical protein